MKTLLQGKAATAVGVIIRKNLIKFNLPDGHSADFSAAVMEIIFGQVQLEYNHVESGGYLTGYVSKETGNVTIDGISTPYNLDQRSLTHIYLRDPGHKNFLKTQRIHESYYLGLWHTHLEKCPEPSTCDKKDWKLTVKTDKSTCRYFFFVIAGTKEMRVWVGEKYHNGKQKISEIFEAENQNGIYHSR